MLTRFVARVRGSFKPYQKSTLLYLLSFLLFFSLVGTTAQLFVSTTPELFLIIYQVCFFIAGIIHYKAMHHYLRWSGDAQSLWLELLFTFIVVALGSIPFILIYNYFNTNGLAYIMAGSSLFFLVPFLFYRSFEKAMAIPPINRKKWFYPVHEEVAEPDEKKLRNLLIISFEFQKQDGDPHYTNFRAKAPTDMEFGQLFYYFINDYNERHPDSKIQFITGTGEPHGWLFFKKPKWYSILTHYMDTEKTIYNNRIRENDIIICRRALN
jgi:hypothetical protein